MAAARSSSQSSARPSLTALLAWKASATIPLQNTVQVSWEQ